MSPFLHDCRGELEGRICASFAGCVSSIVRSALSGSYGTEGDVQLEQSERSCLKGLSVFRREQTVIFT